MVGPQNRISRCDHVIARTAQIEKGGVSHNDLPQCLDLGALGLCFLPKEPTHLETCALRPIRTRCSKKGADIDIATDGDNSTVRNKIVLSMLARATVNKYHEVSKSRTH